MRVTLFVSSLACVVLMGLHAWRENLGPEWRPYQQQYARALTTMAKTDAEQESARAFEIKLRQVVLPEGLITDRCVSCHVAVEDPRMSKAPVPLRTHSGDYLDVHPQERFGCTLCHDGQGRAVDRADAAAYDRARFWEKPLLKPPFVEANCYRCHGDAMDQRTPTYAFGKQIFDASGCIGCHTVRGKGGTVGPDLSEVGDSSRHLKVPTSAHHDLIARFSGNETIAYLYESVRWPDAQPTKTKMPQFNFSDEEAVALTVYLKSFVRRPTLVSLVPPPKPALPPTDPVERGRVLYGKYCIGCHGDSGAGGIPNANARNAVVLPLTTLAARMGFTNRDAVTEFIERTRRIAGAAPQSDPTRPANPPQVEQGLADARTVITRGLAVAKVDRNGPEPLAMPSWQHLIDAQETDALIYYLLTLASWDGSAASRQGRQ